MTDTVCRYLLFHCFMFWWCSIQTDTKKLYRLIPKNLHKPQICVVYIFDSWCTSYCIACVLILTVHGISYLLFICWSFLWLFVCSDVLVVFCCCCYCPPTECMTHLSSLIAIINGTVYFVSFSLHMLVKCSQLVILWMITSCGNTESVDWMYII